MKRAPNIDRATAARIRELALAGVEGTVIADRLGLTLACVHKRISRMGLGWQGVKVRSAKLLAEKVPIGAELRRVRLAKGWRLCDFAKVLNVDSQCVWSAESAPRMYSLRRLRAWLKIAGALGKPPHALGTFDFGARSAAHWGAVLKQLRQLGSEIRPKAWAKHQGISLASAYEGLYRMTRRGLLRRESRGVYRLAEAKSRAA